MMKRYRLPALAVLAAAAVVLTGCTDDSTTDDMDGSEAIPTVPTHFENPDVEALEGVYEVEVSKFPLAMPDGHEFPAEMPPINWFDSVPLASPIEVESAVNQWWGCAKYEAAWDAYEAGEEETATQHISDLYAEIRDGRVGLDYWTVDNLVWGEGFLRARGMGESGYCMQWWSQMEDLGRI